jgi:hypothetical protein
MVRLFELWTSMGSPTGTTGDIVLQVPLGGGDS